MAGPTLGTTLQNYTYQWDKAGNLEQRKDLRQVPTVTEDFTYDDVNRLDLAKRNGATTLDMDYITDGRILSKSDRGTYDYSAGPPHAVSSTFQSCGPCCETTRYFQYDANGNMTCQNAAVPCPNIATPVTWTSFGYVKSITAGGVAGYVYGPNRQVVKKTLVRGGVTTTTRYIGSHFEVETQGATTIYRSAVFAKGRAMYLETRNSNPAIGLQGYFVLRDHAGSIDRLERDSGTGANNYLYSFDAWGKRRDINWTADADDSLLAAAKWTERGYTGQEHVGLSDATIHMNGRVQSAKLGQMLSADPLFGQDLFDPQTANPYAYARNNPASRWDPSGYQDFPMGEMYVYAPSYELYDLVSSLPPIDVPIDIQVEVPQVVIQEQIVVTARRVYNVPRLPRHLTLERIGGPVEGPRTISASAVFANSPRLVLLASLDRKEDADNEIIGVLNPLEGVTVAELWNELLTANASYCNCTQYAFFPGHGMGIDTNSNGYIHALITLTGSRPTVDLGGFVGYGTPPPAGDFGP